MPDSNRRTLRGRNLSPVGFTKFPNHTRAWCRIRTDEPYGRHLESREFDHFSNHAILCSCVVSTNICNINSLNIFTPHQTRRSFFLIFRPVS